MRKKLIIILSISTVLILGSIIALAAFVFTQTVNTTSTTGDITIEKEGYVSYALNSNMSASNYSSTADFQAVLKERAGGTIVDTEGVNFKASYTYYYTRTINQEEEYQENKTYYIKDDTNNYVYAGDIESFATDTTYYTLTYTPATNNFVETATEVVDYDNFDSTKAYYIKDGNNYVYQNITKFASGTTYYTCNYVLNSQAEGVDKNYYRLGHKYDNSITSSNYSGTYTLTGVDSAGYGLFTLASSFDSQTKYYKLTYVPETLTANELITDPNSSDVGVSCVNTYGSERSGSLAETGSYLYLNQVGFEFEISTKIACYVRIKFRDAWISSRLYKGNSTPSVKYTSKQTISGRSPFYVDDENWYFDTENNIAYLKTYMEARDNPYKYSFNLNPQYFYHSNSKTYTERMIIQVSYSLELIQANRAKTVWGIDPSKLA